MNLQKMKNTIDNQQLGMRIERQKKYTCKICGKTDLHYETVNQFSGIQLNDGINLLLQICQMDGPRFRIENDDVVLKPHAIIVCSSECKKKFMIQNGRNFWPTLIEGVGAPEHIKMARDLEVLKNDNADSSGTTNEAKIDAIIERIDSDKGFYLFGTPGCGKSTIAKGLALQYRMRGKFVKWVSYEHLQEALTARQNYDVLLARLVYRHVRFDYDDRSVHKSDPWDVVIVDDISTDFTPNSEQHLRLKNLFSQWYEKGVKMVFTSNVPVQELCKAIAPMVHSRMQKMVAVVTLPSIDYREFEEVG